MSDREKKKKSGHRCAPYGWKIKTDNYLGILWHFNHMRHIDAHIFFPRLDMNAHLILDLDNTTNLEIKIS